MDTIVNCACNCLCWLQFPLSVDMERPPQDVMQYIVQIEEAAEDVLANKHQLVELDKRRQSTRQAVR